MRRFSQRSALVTLSEINITPLLDLAFVLLIIFIITTPLLEQSLPMKLPVGGGPDQKIEKKDISTVEISARGEYRLDKMSMSIGQLESMLVDEFARNPNLVVYIRADGQGPWKNVAAVMDACQKHKITRFSVRMEPPKR